MPRTVRDIVDHGDEPARRFEDYDAADEDERDPQGEHAAVDGGRTYD